MSRRAGTARAKAKKDDIAKAAAEVLNNINTAPTPAVSRPAISGGLLHSAIDGSDFGTDVYLKQPQTSIDQELSTLPLYHRPLLHSIERQSHVAVEDLGGIAQTGTRTQDVGNVDDTGGGSFTCNGIGVKPSNDGGTPGGYGVSADPLTPSSVPPVPAVVSLNQQPGGLTSRMVDVATGAAAGATRLWDVVMRRVVNVVRTACHFPAHSLVAHPQDDQTDGDAAQSGNPVTAAIVPIAVLVLLFSSLALGAASYSLARAGSRAQAFQQEEVYELREQLGDWRKHCADTNREFWEELRGVRRESQRLGLRLVGLESKLETVVEEVRILQRAIEVHNAVQSIVQGDTESGSGRRLDSDGVLETLRPQAAPGAAAEGAALAVKGLDNVGLELQGLTPCHLRRLVAAAGPLLPARMTRHSPVIGDETALMRFYVAMSFIFARGTLVHPIARHITDPAASPTCLPLAVTRGAEGSASGSAFVELRLMTPAIVSAISFRYPGYGTWDTSSALLHLSAVLHEAPAASGTAPTTLKSRNTVGGEPMGDAAVEVRSRHVELPSLKGLECQHVTITSTSAVKSPGDDGSGMLVHGVTLHVNGNFGNPDYSCMPQVLVHGWVP